VCHRTADKESSHPISAKSTWLNEFLFAFSVPSNLSAVLSSALWSVSVFEIENQKKIEILLRTFRCEEIVARKDIM